MSTPTSEPEGAHEGPRAGAVLDGRYRLVERLGRGGFGDVWRAEELLPDGTSFREVALKLLAIGTPDAHWAEEAKLLASFRHPSLVTIYAAGVLGGRAGDGGRRALPQAYVAMELLLGQNLAEVLRQRGRVPWRRALRWASSAAAALDVIHARGVVHLDLKPANLFVTNEGALKVLDFGIARRAGSRAQRSERIPVSLRDDAAIATSPTISSPQEAFAATRPIDSTAGSTTADLVAGTPGFMAPEILEVREPTPASDAYALAVCLVQLATGHLPHAAPDEPARWDDASAVSGWLSALRTATLRGELRDLEHDPAKLPAGLVRLARRLLAVSPEQREVAPGRLGALFEEVWDRPFGVPDPPYQGLGPFSQEAEGLLFGRDDDLGRLGRDLELDGCVVLQGPEGVGRTSLVRAGLAPHLAKRDADLKDDWRLVEVVPGDAPDRALDAALALVAPELAGADLDSLARFAADGAIGLCLFVDPLEGLVDAVPEARARLEAIVVALAAGPARPGLRLVASLTDERTPSVIEHKSLGAAVRRALRWVGPPSQAAARDIVAAPAHFAGVTVYGVDEIASEIQRELGEGGSRTPFVALALAELWRLCEREPRPAREKPFVPGAGPASRASMPDDEEAPPSSMRPVLDVVLRGARWTQAGGFKGALARHADRALGAMTPEERAIADELLVHLVSSEGERVAWSERDLLAAVVSKDAPRVLARLLEARVVARREGVDEGEGLHAGSSPGPSIEIAHEALLTAWVHLTSLRLRHLERLAFLERLREAAVAWERADRHPDFLLAGQRWREVRERAAWTSRGLSERERAFVDRSRAQYRVRVAGRVATVAGLVALVVVGLFAKRALDESRLRTEATERVAAHLAYVGELAQKARRTDDPYHRAAYIAEAMRERSTDGLLPLELAAAVDTAPRATFLSLEDVTALEFPWGPRWLLANGSNGTIEVVDFEPREGIVDDPEIDQDPEGLARRPAVTELAAHADEVVERVAFAFTQAFATRSTTGEVKVFRLRPDGSIALAAIAPIRCQSAMRLARAAAVLACSNDAGLARWDLATNKIETSPFKGIVEDVSADGSRVVGVLGRSALFWRPEAGTSKEIEAREPIVAAAWSPRDPIVALASYASLQVVDEEGRELFDAALVSPPSSVRFAESGVDLAVCTPNGGRFLYLRRGGRAKGDPLPEGSACARPTPPGTPELIADDARPDELRARDLGPHPLRGGFKLGKGRFLARDLVVLDARSSVAERLLRFTRNDALGSEEDLKPTDSEVAVLRDATFAAWQIGTSVRLYALATGRRVVERPGGLVRLCGDGRFLGVRAERDVFVFFDVASGGEVGRVARAPGFFLGADRACKHAFTQTLDGAILRAPIGGGAAQTIARADGYVYDVRVVEPLEHAHAALLFAVSSGAIARVDEGADVARVLGYASPRATAIAPGHHPGEVVYADATGVVVLDAHGRADRLLEATAARTWDDLAVAPDGASVLLASADRLAVLDVARREIVGAIPIEGKSRLLPWDAEGSILAWSFDRMGGAEGQVVPRGVDLARHVASALANLRVEHGKLGIER